ncbi:TAXI family TRAP transporter solute-binding subunit [Paraburkholderia mimosarum]|uniref:TAXI family TRAP transporter solute-binding subunit n=1 Tax=Paraburkholderia mimosarum TaxID=312026 RepID=UPI0039C4358A
MKSPTGRKPRPRLVARFVAISWRDLAVTFGPILLVSAAAIWLAVRLIQPAPPNTLTMSAGPKGSTYWNAAQKYKEILARNKIALTVLESEGSLQNLRRVADPDAHVDVAFVQDGLASKVPGGLVSLGSVAYVPLVVFYHGPVATRLSQFAGQRLAIGAEGSGTRELALTLLKANGIEPGGSTKLLPLSGEDAARALVEGKTDVAFLAGDSAQPPVMGRLMRTPGVRFFDFTQADAYARRFPYLTAITIPMGAFDFGRNLPPEPLQFIAPTAELVARDSLHPALSDLLIEAAKEVHGRSTLLQRAGEFPSPRAQDFPISADAARYYKSGKSFLYRVLPFWVASLADRLVVLLVPIIVVLIPGMRIVPSLYAWRVKSRIYRWYGSLIALERAAMADISPAERQALLRRLDSIEESVNGMKMPLAYAEQFYVLREHIGFVRARLAEARDTRAADRAEGEGAQEGESQEADTAGNEASHAEESGGNDTGERTH